MCCFCSRMGVEAGKCGGEVGARIPLRRARKASPVGLVPQTLWGRQDFRNVHGVDIPSPATGSPAYLFCPCSPPLSLIIVPAQHTLHILENMVRKNKTHFCLAGRLQYRLRPLRSQTWGHPTPLSLSHPRKTSSAHPARAISKYDRITPFHTSSPALSPHHLLPELFFSPLMTLHASTLIPTPPMQSVLNRAPRTISLKRKSDRVTFLHDFPARLSEDTPNSFHGPHDPS